VQSHDALVTSAYVKSETPVRAEFTRPAEGFHHTATPCKKMDLSNNNFDVIGAG
jgi:hypothetical protein